MPMLRGRGRFFRFWCSVATSALSFLAMTASVSAEPTVLKLIVFRSAASLAIFVGQEKGLFEANGLRVELTNTPSSTEQIRGVLAGKWDLMHTAADNVVAYVENEGADLFMFMGIGQGAPALYARPEIKGFQDLRGKKVAVDALTTGYAFVLFDILERNGLKRGQDYEVVSVGGTDKRFDAMTKGEVVATLLTPPYDTRAVSMGYTSFGSSKQYLGEYQASTGATTRRWARDHTKELIAYIRSYRLALAWIFNPVNAEEAVKILARRLELPDAVAANTFKATIVHPTEGISRDASLSMKGIETVIRLRGEMGFLKSPFPPAAKYVDPTFYEQASQPAPTPR
jgi:ABC-type nitrate/sulfonate/bicarbonate transport system substrate-binding protein